MAIEIRELFIKAAVVPDGSTGQASAPQTSSGNNASPTDELINTCVEKILEIIKDKNVR